MSQCYKGDTCQRKFFQNSGEVWRGKLRGALHLHAGPRLCSVCRELPLCHRLDPLHSETDRRGHHEVVLLRHMLLLLPHGHGDEQQGAHVGQLPDAGRGQIVQADSGHGSRSSNREKAISCVEVPLHPPHCGGSGHVHVQG